MQERLWRKVNLVHCWWECKLIQPLWRTIWRFLKKLKIELPYNPTSPLLGIYMGKTIIQKGIQVCFEDLFESYANDYKE